MSLPPMDSEAFLDLPAMPPPPGVTPNFVNPSNLRQPGLVAVQITLATIAVAMRLYTKKFIVRRMLAEDWWLLAAYICFACFQVNMFMLENLPIGVHMYDMTMRTLIRNSKGRKCKRILYLFVSRSSTQAMIGVIIQEPSSLTIIQIFHISVAVYSIVSLPLKVAIILQIRRIVLNKTQTELRGPYRGSIIRWVIDFFIAVNVIFYAFIVLFQLLTCQPLRKAWDFRLPGHCVPHRLVIHICSATINATSDLVTIILPQPVIWSLKMDNRKKLGLSAVFLLGGLACAMSAFRLYYTVLLYNAADQTYAVGRMVKWAEPELILGFLATCLPVLPTIMRHIYSQHTLRTGHSAAAANPDGSGNNSSVMGNRITKKVVMDIEFAQLTALEDGDHRSDSLHSLNGGSEDNKKQYEVLPIRHSTKS